MAITYPLNTPTNIGIANITLMAENAVAVSQSPFTFAQQIVAHPGQRWAASISLPPMKRQDAENWIAFLLSLKGQVGTFLLGDPNGVNDQGVAAARRNILTFTEQFDNAAWTKSNVSITPDVIAAPDGTQTADAVVSTAVVTVAGVSSATFSADGVSTYTASLFFKKTTGLGTDFQLYFRGSLSVGTQYAATILNTSTGFVGGGPYTIQDLGDWWRVSITASNIPAGSMRFHLRYVSQPVGTTVHIWGAQLEVGPSVSAYQGVVDTFGPLVNGASQTGNVLNIDGCSPNVTGWFAPGDYIQLGSGSATQLYKVLTSVNTNNSGQASVDIWPNLRSSPADNSAVIFTNAKGKFRLKDNVTQWGINEISSYGITFDCVEAL